jgi:hypothetical protein
MTELYQEGQTKMSNSYIQMTTDHTPHRVEIRGQVVRTSLVHSFNSGQSLNHWALVVPNCSDSNTR